MTMNPLPPQAYDKDTLLKAFQWLQCQNPSIKEMATTPDILVSLYLKTKLNGNEALERPSIQNFKTELKNLAGMMGKFEDSPAAPQSHISPSGTTNSVVTSAQTALKASQIDIHDLDYKTQSMIREVKAEYNLSSDCEALRMMVSVAYKRLKTL